MSHFFTLDSVSEKKRGGTFIFILKLVELFFFKSLFVVSGLISVIQLNLFQVSLL